MTAHARCTDQTAQGQRCRLEGKADDQGDFLCHNHRADPRSRGVDLGDVDRAARELAALRRLEADRSARQVQSDRTYEALAAQARPVQAASGKRRMGVSERDGRRDG